ncbi:hypothetical protein [Microcoleus sp. BROC3]|uniref:hypothetical protein n=1 Tax=Microcoleus sp. BROC3 TaxID=3055323 RepID=UPI002FD28307
MAQNITLCDEYGIIYEAMEILPDDELKICFLKALAEFEDNECHRTSRRAYDLCCIKFFSILMLKRFMSISIAFQCTIIQIPTFVGAFLYVLARA